MSVFNGARKNLRVDRLVLVKPQAVNDSEDALASEQAHEVVLQGKVESALTGIALTARTAAKLIVDAAALVALRTENKESARGADTSRLRRDLLLILFKPLAEQRARFGAALVDLVRHSRRRSDFLLAVPVLFQIDFGKELRVSAEHDIRTASRHVRRNGDGAEFARLRHDFRFALVLLGVEHVVRDALFFQ